MTLRSVTPEDLHHLVGLDSDPRVMQFINGGRPVSRATYEDGMLARMCALPAHGPGFLLAFAADEVGQGAFLGWFHLRPSVFDDAILEVGYRLLRAAWGRGLATEGSRALVNLAFAAPSADTVDACAMADNHRSIGVLEKCGMSAAGQLRHPRAGTEVVRYVVARETWRALPWSGGAGLSG